MIDEQRTIRIEVTARRWWWWLLARPTLVLDGDDHRLHFGLQHVAIDWGRHHVALVVEWRWFGGLIHRYVETDIEVTRENPAALLYGLGPLIIMMKSDITFQPHN